MHPHIDELVSNPNRHFTSPHDVVGDRKLSQGDKIKILESWKLDAMRLAESTAENMSGGEQSDLHEVSRALTEVKMMSARTHHRDGRPRSHPVRVGLGFIVGGVIGAGLGLFALAGAGWSAIQFGAGMIPPIALLLQTAIVGSLLGGLTSAVRRAVQHA